MSRTEFGLALKPDTYERVKGRGLRFNPRLVLDPGRYQLRVGVRESATGRTGTVFHDLVVPDFRKERLALSGLLLTTPSATDSFAMLPDSAMPDDLGGPATSRRDFRTS